MREKGGGGGIYEVGKEGKVAKWEAREECLIGRR